MAKSKAKRKARERGVKFARASRLRFGKLETRGIPSILLGVATIVLAAGAGAALRKSVTLVPETLREAREFWLAARAPRRELPG